jgi:ribosomal protein S18 acetylase RimI-like enzyme
MVNQRLRLHHHDNYDVNLVDDSWRKNFIPSSIPDLESPIETMISTTGAATNASTPPFVGLPVDAESHPPPGVLPVSSSSSSSPKIIFRSIQPSDRQTIQQLHEQWFPVKYQTEFYDDLVHGKLYPNGEDLYTNLAVVVPEDGPAVGQIQTDKIIACIVATMIPAHRINRTSRELILPDSFQPRTQGPPPISSSAASSSVEASACYIMTLGTVPEFRHFRLATTLVQKCIQDLVVTNPTCGALYLHVITSNPAAIAFYEQDTLRFYRVKEIPNYYAIDDRFHNCYLYAKYFHGTYLLEWEWRQRYGYM